MINYNVKYPTIHDADNKQAGNASLKVLSGLLIKQFAGNTENVHGTVGTILVYQAHIINHVDHDSFRRSTGILGQCKSLAVPADD